MVAAMKNFALVLAALPLALACETTEVSCGMLIRDEALGACVCPPGVEVDYERWLCLFPDAAVPIDPFDAGLDAGSDAGVVDAGLDGGFDGGVDAGMDTGPACTPTDEVCEGSIDEDCDDAIDEGCDCTTDEERACGPDQGVCVAGRQVCDSGAWGECEGADIPGTEACDGSLDEDCDGSVDEGCACTDGAMRPCPGGIDTGECAAGTQTCVSGMWAGCVGAIGPTAEVCDGRDNDCDTVIDGPAASAACGSAPNATTLVCSAGDCIIAGCVPGTDDCNDDVIDGCEVDLTIDPRDCGMCGRVCSPSQLCASSTCTNAPLTTTSQPRAIDCDACPFDNYTGDWTRTKLEIASASNGRPFVLQNWESIGGVGGDIFAYDVDLGAIWSVGSILMDYTGLACTASTCSTSILDEAGDDQLVRIGLTGSTPARAALGTHRESLAPLLATPDGRWLHISSAFERPLGAPDVSLVAPAGSVAFMGRRDLAYTTSSTRQLRATRLTGASAWTFSLPVGWTIRDGAVGVASASGVETNVYTIATRTMSGRVQSRVSMVDDGGSEAEWADLVDGTRDYVAEAIAIAPNGDVYVVGTRGNRGFLAVYEQDMSLIYVREATGTAYSRFMDITFLPSGEALLLGLRTAGTLTFGGSTMGSGSTPSGSPNDLEADAFILRLRVE